MNRKVLGGIAVCAAILGVAILGSDSKVDAGIFGGCGGAKKCGGLKLFKNRCAGSSCAGAVADCGGSDCGGSDCGGRVGLLAKLRARRAARCSGASCHGAPACHGAPSCDASSCGGRKGLFARLRARRAARCSGCAGPSDCCGAPEPACCPAPEPCCTPAPEPCCTPAPAPCCESGEVIVSETVVEEVPAVEAPAEATGEGA